MRRGLAYYSYEKPPEQDNPIDLNKNGDYIDKSEEIKIKPKIICFESSNLNETYFFNSYDQF